MAGLMATYGMGLALRWIGRCCSQTYAALMTDLAYAEANGWHFEDRQVNDKSFDALLNMTIK